MNFFFYLLFNFLVLQSYLYWIEATAEAVHQTQNASKNNFILLRRQPSLTLTELDDDLSDSESDVSQDECEGNDEVSSSSTISTGSLRSRLDHSDSSLSSQSDDDDMEGIADDLTPSDQSTESSSTKDSVTTEVSNVTSRFADAIQSETAGESQERPRQENHANEIHVGKLLAAYQSLEEVLMQMSMSQGARDLKGNVEKVRKLYINAPPEQRNSLVNLLKYELSTGVHDGWSGRQIRDPSAAMGFLWLGRSLNYQHDMILYMLDHHDAEPFDAAKHAYERDLKPYHSWPIQQICLAAMLALKRVHRTTVLANIGGFNQNSFGMEEGEATERDLRQLTSVWEPILSQMREVFAELELEAI